MSLIFPRAAFYPVRCAPTLFRLQPSYTMPSAHDIAPLFNLFDETFAQLERAATRHSRSHFKRPFNPKFDIKESNQTYLVEGELPGFDAKDISIEFLDEGHTLQIKGKTVSRAETGKPVEAATTTNAETPKAVEATPAETSETSSVKSHQATVEDEPESSEAPANASATAEASTTPAPQTEAAPAEQQQQQQQVTETKAEEPRHHIIERYTGEFTRTFRFSDKVDQEAVRASLKDGILAITLPFARKPESRRIQIE